MQSLVTPRLPNRKYPKVSTLLILPHLFFLNPTQHRGSRQAVRTVKPSSLPSCQPVTCPWSAQTVSSRSCHLVEPAVTASLGAAHLPLLEMSYILCTSTRTVQKAHPSQTCEFPDIGSRCGCHKRSLSNQCSIPHPPAPERWRGPSTSCEDSLPMHIQVPSPTSPPRIRMRTHRRGEKEEKRRGRNYTPISTHKKRNQ